MPKVLLYIFKKAQVALFVTCLAGPLHGQNMQQVRQDLQKLTSAQFFGRGYVKNGQAKAARYLQKRFQQIGLLPLVPQYLQAFEIPIHTFPKKVSLIQNGKHLTTGVDYILSADCPAIRHKFTLKVLDSATLTRPDFLTYWQQTASPQVAALVRPNAKKTAMHWLNSSWQPGLVIFEEKKLTATLSPRPAQTPIVYAKENTLQEGDMVEIHVQAKTYSAYQVHNVLGYVKGTVYSDSFYVVTAHYDHLGGMGRKTYFPGANDNASGTALLLALAEHFTQKPMRYSVAFMAFGAEEAGLLGSMRYTAQPVFPLSNIKFLVNTDLAGTGDDGITVVNATAYEEIFQRLDSINRQHRLLPQVVRRGQAANSDHYPFALKGVPAFFIYTRGGIDAYHDVYDRYHTLPLTKFKELFTLICLFLESEPKVKR